MDEKRWMRKTPLLLIAGAVLALALGLFVLGGRNLPPEEMAAQSNPPTAVVADERVGLRDAIPSPGAGHPQN
jgi:hypothetical protein